jgi:hypothetical protein
MKRLALIATLLTMAVAPATALASPVPSTVKITDAFVDMSGIHFEGKVKSPRPRCEGPGRFVHLYRARPGEDTYINSGPTAENGHWEIVAPTVAGTYYAKIPKLLSLGDERPCARDKSKKVELN